MGDEAEVVASSAWGVGSLRRAEGGGVLAGDDFWGEMDLARSVCVRHGTARQQPAARNIDTNIRAGKRNTANEARPSWV